MAKPDHVEPRRSRVPLVTIAASRFPDPLEDARASCTPKRRCRLGWILADSGRDSWDVWLDVQTGEGRLRRRKD